MEEEINFPKWGKWEGQRFRRRNELWYKRILDPGSYVAPNSTTRVFGRGELVMDAGKIARRYLRSDFFIDFIATLPLPQIVIWFIIPATRSPRTDHKNNALALIVLLQYIPRLYLIFPLSSQIIKAMEWLQRRLGRVYFMLEENLQKGLASLGCNLSYLDCDTFGHSDRSNWTKFTDLFAIPYGEIRGWRLKRRDKGVDEPSTAPEDLRHRVRRLFSINGLQLVELMKKPFCMAYLLIFFVTFNATYGWILFACKLLSHVPFFSQMDDQLLDAICERLVSLSTEGSQVRGQPFRRLHSKKLQQTFWFYSYHWRTWAASFIQACLGVGTKEDVDCRSFASDEKEDDETKEEGRGRKVNSRLHSFSGKMNLRVTILASRFAANTRRGAQKIKMLRCQNYKNQRNPTFLQNLTMTDKMVRFIIGVYTAKFLDWGRTF
ncbi:cation/hydrogen exchanger family protein [Hibiscus syriacus]|uniref:Cation/hydrogen exchanger family protein n=1 Tax=Hibiscus syriacus TaxID=106335 RepID=A0A6A2WGN0_HIBSY|nr:cation/hydrogen exchanger family protein [Hibiscus syriacus]